MRAFGWTKHKGHNARLCRFAYNYFIVWYDENNILQNEIGDRPTELQEPVFDKNEQVLYKGELATFMNYNRQETVEEALRPCQISVNGEILNISPFDLIKLNY
jgi:hypothetical protein